MLENKEAEFDIEYFISYYRTIKGDPLFLYCVLAICRGCNRENIDKCYFYNLGVARTNEGVYFE